MERPEPRWILKALKARGIGSAVYYPLPLHLQPCFAYLGYRPGRCPEAERAAGEVLSLPVHPALEPTDVARIAETVTRRTRS